MHNHGGMSMEQVIVPLLSALIGALIGAAGSVAVVFIQARKENQRHRREIATTIALENRNSHIDMVKQDGGAIFPIELYLAHSVAVLDAIDSGEITPEKLDAISRKQAELRAAILQNSDGLKPPSRRRG